MEQTRGLFEKRFIKWGTTALTFAVSAGILGYLIYTQRNLLLSHEWSFRWQPLVLSLAAYSIALFIVVAVWVMIINSFGANISIRQHFLYYCVSNLSRRLPGTIWYIAYRARFYQQEGLSVRLTSLATAIEFAVSVISASIISLIFAAPLLLKYLSGSILAVILLIVCIVFFHPSVIKWLLKRVGQNEQWYDIRQILYWTMIYLVSWVVSGTLFFLTANVIYPIDLQNLRYVIGAFAIVGLVGRAITFLPSNMGLQELSYSILLSPIMPASIAFVLAIENRILVIFFEILWTLISLLVHSSAQSVINPK